MNFKNPEQDPLVLITTNRAQARTITEGLKPLPYPILAIENGVPVFAVHPTRSAVDGQMSLWFRCPICSAANMHTVYHPPGHGDGWKFSRCRCWERTGYAIEEQMPY